MKPVSGIDDPRYVKALSHPLRVRIFGVLEQRTASPVELADELGATLGTVSYHVRVLNDLGLLKLVGRTPRRGAIEHHYRAKPRPRPSLAEWTEAPPIAKQAVVRSTLQQISEAAGTAGAGGGFDRPEARLSRRAVQLDDKGWQQLAAAVDRFEEQVNKIEAGVQQRNKGGATSEAGLATVLFDAEPLKVAPEEDGATPRRRGAGRRR